MFIDASRFSKWSKLIKTTILALEFIKRITKNRFKWLSPISDVLCYIIIKEDEVDKARKDGKVRTTAIELPNGKLLKRSVSVLPPLEIDSEIEIETIENYNLDFQRGRKSKYKNQLQCVIEHRREGCLKESESHVIQDSLYARSHMRIPAKRCNIITRVRDF
ncbi:unnamed protein product [Dracunculus medinensis]|uniref:Uncharacterized protein n=1 Tax=Dracunculus medinensis TaxID=318479 RepID=A0A158Q6D4_DRAME|nr:unnamed protein product [Dracunculus medinensis]